MSKYKRIGMLDVSEAVNAMLSSYGEEVGEVVDSAMKDVATEAMESLKGVNRFSPRGNPTGDYAKDWDLMVEPVKRYTRRYVVYNIDHYQLTHLLESGHAKFLWGKPTGDSVQGYSHIEPVNEQAQEKVIQEIKERVESI